MGMLAGIKQTQRQQEACGAVSRCEDQLTCRGWSGHGTGCQQQKSERKYDTTNGGLHSDGCRGGEQAALEVCRVERRMSCGLHESWFYTSAQNSQSCTTNYDCA